jgi:cytidine deaminase
VSTPVDSADLVARARGAAAFSWSPYSRFPVGAALLCEDGSVVTGTNVENRSYGLTNCAERSALFAAVSQGRRAFRALAVCCTAAREPVPPCGACRQALSEFCPPDMPVYYTGGGDAVVETTIGALLPADSLHDLKHAAEG